MADRRYCIGFITNRFENNYSLTICKGAAIAAEEMDVDIVFFPGHDFNITPHDSFQSTFDYQNHALFSLVHKQAVDALVVPLGMVVGRVGYEDRSRFLSRFDGIPTVVCELEHEGYPSVTFNTNGLTESIDHLAQAHGCKRIAFVSGPKDQPDASARLTAYKNALLANGLPVDEALIAYGDFSEYSYDVVAELLDRSDTLPDAICFANDSMAIGAYSVLQDRGIVPGKDIAVIGYDNDRFSGVMDPPLTTVDVGIINLGYTSVKAAVDLIEKGSIESIVLDSSLTIRRSCGCSTYEAAKTSDKKPDAQQLTELVLKQFSGINHISKLNLTSKLLRDFVNLFFTEALDHRKKHFSHRKLCDSFADLIATKFMHLFNHDAAPVLLGSLKAAAEPHIKSAAKKLSMYQLFDSMQTSLNEYYAERIYHMESDSRSRQLLVSHITKDMTAYSKEENECYRRLIDDISHFHFESTYIYLFEHPYKGLSQSELAEWKPPKRVLLKAYHNGQDIYLPFKEDQYVDTADFFRNTFISADRRRTAALTLLGFNDELFGFTVTETEPESFTQLGSIAQQICTSIKMTDFMLMLEDIISQITQRNAILSHESVSDELTGLLNRRGFFSEAEKALASRAKSHTKQHCAIMFADLNHLKEINDTFGHEEGDYAIKTAAQILRTCLRSSDIIGRVGGDEFAVLTIYNDDTFAERLFKRVKQFQDNLNLETDKPYYVELSIGIHEFDCTDHCNLQELLDNADNKLYIDKKSKRPSSLRTTSGS